MTNTSIVAIVFVFLLVSLWNPFYLWMPTELQYLTVGALAVVAAIFAGLLLGDSAKDEREEELRAKSARIGYLVGVFVLVLGVAISVLTNGKVDQWLLIALGAMVLSRFLNRLKSE